MRCWRPLSDSDGPVSLSLMNASAKVLALKGADNVTVEVWPLGIHWKGQDSQRASSLQQTLEVLEKVGGEGWHLKVKRALGEQVQLLDWGALSSKKLVKRNDNV